MRYITTALLLICLSHIATAQSSVKIILINGVATEVELTESGDVIQLIDVNNNYMSDYEGLPITKLKLIVSSEKTHTIPESFVNTTDFSIPTENHVSSDSDSRQGLIQVPSNIKE